MKKSLAPTPSILAKRRYRENSKEKYQASIEKYRSTHDMLAFQRKYDRSRAEYKKYARALLRLLNNLYVEPTPKSI